MQLIPPEFQDLVGPNSKAIGYLAFTLKDGAPIIAPIWFSAEDGYIWVNSSEGTLKDKRFKTMPPVALVIQDPVDRYRYLQIRGRVVAVQYDGALEHLHALSRCYDGQDFDDPGPTPRVMYKIEIEKVNVFPTPE